MIDDADDDRNFFHHPVANIETELKILDLILLDFLVTNIKCEFLGLLWLKSLSLGRMRASAFKFLKRGHRFRIIW